MQCFPIGIFFSHEVNDLEKHCAKPGQGLVPFYYKGT